MSSFRADPLLGSTRMLLTLALVVFGIGIVGCGIAILAVTTIGILQPATILAEAPPLAHPFLLDIVIAGGIAALAVMGAFVWKLRQIVETVATGEPFTRENAVRLRVMAWLALASQLVQLPIHGALLAMRQAMITSHAFDGHKIAIQHDAGFSLEGIVLALVLFILARVFQTGAKMREDLEGTV